MQEEFETITNDIVNYICNLKYDDVPTEIMRIEILQNLCRFLQSYDQYEHNKKVLNKDLIEENKELKKNL